jgi:hypothetical protein
MNKHSVILGFQAELHVLDLAELGQEVQRLLSAGDVLKGVINELLKVSLQIIDLLLESIIVRIIFLSEPLVNNRVP